MFQYLKNDAALWESVRHDDGAAFNELFNRYWARLYKIAFHQLRDEAESQEIVHDVFLSIWNRRKELEINAFPNFLLTAVRYQLYTRRKSTKLSIVYKADLSESLHAADLNLGDIHMRDQELQQVLHTHLDQLPRRCHEIFQLSRIEHLSNQDIAERLGVSRKTVENQLTVALKHLRVVFKNMASFFL